MASKQNWTVTLEFVETEGENTPRPWYRADDIKNLIRLTLVQAGKIRDLELKEIRVAEKGGVYL